MESRNKVRTKLTELKCGRTKRGKKTSQGGTTQHKLVSYWLQLMMP